jgi:outer membrane protein assembly factor BamA
VVVNEGKRARWLATWPRRSGVRGIAAAVVLAAAAPLAAGQSATGPAAAQSPSGTNGAREGAPAAVPLPSFAELEAAGATIGEIRVVTNNIFDTSDPRENRALYRGANALHIKTRPNTVRRALLFEPGQRVSASIIAETERVLRGERYLYDVRIRPVAVRDGVVDIEVQTSDTWTLYPTLSISRSGGENKSAIGITELNLLGTGSKLSLGSFKDVDRDGKRMEFSNDNVFGRWVALDLGLSDNSDGSKQSLSLRRPFYALDTRWAAGARYASDDRIEPVYNAGETVAEYRLRQRLGEVFGGLSGGRVAGWVQRYSLGVSLQEERFALEPGRVPPAELPDDEKLIGPFVRYELVEDRYVQLQNRNFMGRPEYFAYGLSAQLQLGWADTSFGSTYDALLYQLSVTRGFEPAPQHNLLATAAVSGQYTDGEVRRQQAGGRAQYFLPHHRRWLFYAALAGDVLTNPDATDFLYLGGDNGLRGYPQRYQSGTQRVLLTLEERLYTAAFPWRLIRIGAAAYVDVGRAWGGTNINTEDPGWLANVGFGLRFFSVRTAESNVVHMDVAFPLSASDDVRSVQFLLSGKSRF